MEYGALIVFDVNRASIAEIEAVPGMERDSALLLHLWQPYASWQEIEEVPGLGAEMVTLLQNAGVRLEQPQRQAWSPPADPYHW